MHINHNYKNIKNLIVSVKHCFCHTLVLLRKVQIPRISTTIQFTRHLSKKHRQPRFNLMIVGQILFLRSNRQLFGPLTRAKFRPELATWLAWNGKAIIHRLLRCRRAIVLQVRAESVAHARWGILCVWFKTPATTADSLRPACSAHRMQFRTSFPYFQRYLTLRLSNFLRSAIEIKFSACENYTKQMITFIGINHSLLLLFCDM